MGNEASKLKGLVVDKNAVESNDFYSLFNAELPSNLPTTATSNEGMQLLSVFQGDDINVKGQLWATTGPMERAVKNLMIYRHPYILKYVSNWERGGHKYLATERVRPLSAVLNQQSDIQICLGLRTILCSLIFLIEKAMARHLNICTSSIYITEDGSWRLAGFEYVWKSKELNKTLLDLAKSCRYAAAVDAQELLDKNSDYIEQFAFGTLCEEVLKQGNKNTDNATPHVQEFREYCATHLKHKQSHMRPSLSAVLLHPYFNHEFVLIHSFLFELPLKNIQPKQDFFTGLIDRLRYFNEEVVASQLAADLLSRMVLLDPTAQLCVTPYVLKTKTSDVAALFSQNTYKRHVMPQILRMFRLRDAQIRLILLEYFMEYVRLLTKSELEEAILPHLLSGMNDTNDVLVAKTLRCLADLIPILGSAMVLGGNRMRLFSDGRPQAAVSDATQSWVEPRSITPVMGGGVMDYMVSGSPLPQDNADFSDSSLPRDALEMQNMPARPSPDGGEDERSLSILDSEDASILTTPATMQNSSVITNDNEKSKTEIAINEQDGHQQLDEDDDEAAWSDWETEHNAAAVVDNANISNTLYKHEDVTDLLLAPNALVVTAASSYTTLESQTSLESFKTTQSTCSTFNTATSGNITLKAQPNRLIDDLNSLDIQVQKNSMSKKGQSDAMEFDFFKDMQPIIVGKPAVLELPTSYSAQDLEESDVQIDSKRFAAMNIDLNASADTNDAGWDVEDDASNDWND